MTRLCELDIKNKSSQVAGSHNLFVTFYNLLLRGNKEIPVTVLCSNRTFPQPQRGKMSLWRFSQVLMDPCCQGELGIWVLSTSRSIKSWRKENTQEWYKLTPFQSHKRLHSGVQIDSISFLKLNLFHRPFFSPSWPLFNVRTDPIYSF